MAREKTFEERINMVNTQLIRRGILDEKVIHAMKSIPRHEFVSLQYKSMAYFDGPLPIGKKQTISQPYIIAYMTEVLQVRSNHIVLEIGTGCGYQTAVLSLLAKKIISLEIQNTLATTAEKRLTRLGFNNVEVHQADGKLGWDTQL